MASPRQSLARCGVLIATLMLGAGACGGKGSGFAAGGLHTCAPDAAAWVTVSSQDGGVTAGGVSLPCPGPISTYCSDYATHCPPENWADVVASQNTTGLPPNLYICDPYNWVDDVWVCADDRPVLFAYDKGTGKLLAAIESSRDATTQTCLAGPATIAPLGSCTEYFNCFPNDAGWGQGHCYGDGGADGPAAGGD